MKVSFAYGRQAVELSAPDGAAVFASRFPAPGRSASDEVLDAVRGPIGGGALRDALRGRRDGEVAVVVSDVTRPVPYAHFLPQLVAEVEAAGPDRSEITILIATGMHRPSTPDERAAMLGAAAERYRVIDHRADDDSTLVDVPGRTAGGMPVRLNRRYVEAGFRLVTGLVEPHFMAGFSGGRKAICPGLASLDTVRHFHGAEIMGHPGTRNAVLEGNPCHREALSVARLEPPDFTVNVVLDSHRRLVRAFAGEMEAAHDAACAFVRRCACPPVPREADVVVTSCGGYPLDATFYQCVKGFVSCLPAVREGGAIVAFGSCSEGIGSPEYEGLMRRYSGHWPEFLNEIDRSGVFIRDQWEFQMHCRALRKVGEGSLHFVTDGLSRGDLDDLSVAGHAVAPGAVPEVAQGLIDELTATGRTVALIPEGPYCAPIAAGT